MAATAVIVYHGQIRRTRTFRDHYERIHVPMLWNLPGLRRIELDWDDSGDIPLVTHLIFDTLDQLETSLNGPERDDLRVDMERNLSPLFEGSVLRAEAERVVFGPPS